MIGTKVEAPSADLSADLYDVTIEETSKKGLIQYEVSNFALPGHECRHNLNYWQLGDYIGIGPGAASRLAYTNDGSVPNATGEMFRVSGMCTKSPEKWKRDVKSRGLSTTFELLTPYQSFLELMLTGMRTKKGVSLSQIDKICNARLDGPVAWTQSEDFPVELSPFFDISAVRQFQKSGHIEIVDGYLRPTSQGIMMSDSILKGVLKPI
jgi:oxygen-independent coproporphyrinogen-3 oxidase